MNLIKPNRHDMAYGKSRFRKTQSDKVLRDKAFKITSDPKYDGYQRELASMVYKCFDKRSSESGVAAEPNYELVNELTDTTSKITNRKLYVPIVTFCCKDNVKMVKLLEGFKRPVYWNEYQAKIESRNLDSNNLTRFPLDAYFQGVRKLFALASDDTDNDAKKVQRNSDAKYFFPRVNITNYNVLIDGKLF